MIKLLCSIVLLLGTAAACGSDDEPSPDAGKSFDSGLPTVDAMPGAAIAYMEPCDIANDQCAEGLLCFSFNNKGPHCTHSCTGPDDCEAPSTGCSGMNVCKVP